MTSNGLPRLAAFGELSTDELVELYDYPAAVRWVRANFVASLDGAVTVDGRVGTLTTAADQRLLTLLRDLADVLLVGAATVRVEGYTGIRTSGDLQRWRLSRGLTPITQVAVVSGRADLNPNSALFTNTSVPPVVYTSTGARPEAKQALADAGADVVEIGSGNLEVGAILDDLASRGMTRILCEGGPNLLGSLISEDLLDELCVTTAPVLVGGSASRVATSARVAGTAMRCQHIIAGPDGSQFARWVRAAEGEGAGFSAIK